MARRRSTADGTSREIEDPFPSSPNRPARWGLYYRNEKGKQGYSAFYACYAAQQCLDMLTAGQWRWVNKSTVCGANGVVVSVSSSFAGDSDALEKIAEYEPTPEELDWVAPQVNRDQWSNFSGTKAPPSAAPVGLVNHQTSVREKRTPAARPGDGVTISELAAQLQMEPRDARKILRDSKVEKPAAGWVWSREESKGIESLLRKGSKR